MSLFVWENCNETLIISIDISKNTEIFNFMKILPVGSEFFHAGGQKDGQTDSEKPDEANNRFPKFCERA